MPRGKKRKIIVEKISKKKVKIKTEIKKAVESYDRNKILKNAKTIGLFSYNKMYRQYEIIIPLEEYEKI